jgi:predicted lipoprotein with Yx(FWY)xxD motif
MVEIVRFRLHRWMPIGIILAAGLLLVAACATAATAGRATVRATTGTAMVTTRSGPAGTYLTDGAGKSLYLFAADTGPTSTCVGSCATYWPPMTTTGTPTAGPGVTASMLSTSPRPDGTKQVDYNGHPLYYYIGDQAAGDTAGQGKNLSGGLWWLVAPTGKAIMSGSSSTPAAPAPAPSPAPTPGKSKPGGSTWA